MISQIINRIIVRDASAIFLPNSREFVVCFSFFFWLRVLDKAEYSAFESTLNSSIVSYRILEVCLPSFSGHPSFWPRVPCPGLSLTAVLGTQDIFCIVFWPVYIFPYTRPGVMSWGFSCLVWKGGGGYDEVYSPLRQYGQYSDIQTDRRGLCPDTIRRSWSPASRCQAYSYITSGESEFGFKPKLKSKWSCLSKYIS